MKNKRKLGQAIIEYVLLLIIPVLLISVLPNLNKTVELTLNTVGVDLMEEEGQTPDTPDPICNDEDICSPKILYPPVANMELPDNKDCNEKGVYRKGASNNVLIGKPNAIWAKGEDPVNDWFEIRRPYDESATDDLYYNIANVTSITPGMSLKIGDEIIEHVELIYGQARSSAAEMDVKTLGTDIIASAFNGQISTDKIKNDKNQSIAQQKYTNMVSLATPNQMCKWTSRDYGAVSSANGTAYYTPQSNRKFGGTMAPTDPNYNGGCITAGTTTPYKISDGSTTKKQLTGITERQANSLGIVTDYDLGSSVGFYSVALYVTPGVHATNRGAIQNQCFYFNGTRNGVGKYIPATTIVSGDAISENSNQYWCGKSTMYVKTNEANSVPGLTGRQVMEIIFKDNGNTYAGQQTANYDFFKAVKEQVDSCYEKAGTAQCRNFTPKLQN